MSEPTLPRSNLDLVNEADDFPIPQKDLSEYLAARKLYYHLHVDGIKPAVGIVHPKVVDALRSASGWRVTELADHKTITILGNDEPTRSRVVADTLSQLRDAGRFEVLSRWRGELKPVFGPSNQVLFSVERAAASVLGIVQYGIHLSIYTYEKGNKFPSIWISKRSQRTANYSGMLDNTVAGGYRTGEDPLQTVIREADEEASIPADLVRSLARPCGTISYFHHLDKHVRGEKYLVQPEVEYLYEMQAPEGLVPRPNDGEVEWFQLWDVDKIKDGLGRGLFKPSYVLVLLDFFIRHGVLDTTNEPDYIEICCRLRRTLEFPVRSDA
ncbi:NUDIX hydrolase domain-like protein [Cercophora samala]|uniref:NUDIX hydrolase domain-like protein n=1 Tax=Cercophora samala TaxID=330535 RepID=A0AA39ZLW2_9PEZI|nr:NUDIX hydrolase domain-like protein [Cercophora samala]